MANELTEVQPLIEKRLLELGWQKRTKIALEPRRYLDEGTLRQKLAELNPTKTEKEIDAAIEHLKSLTTLCDVLDAFKQSSLGVRFFDLDNVENNLFYFAREVQLKGKKRPDFLLFINGIPFIIIEAKSTEIDIEKEDTGKKAMEEIFKYYSHKVPELFYTVHIGIGFGNRHYYAAVQPYMKDGYRVVWRDEKKKDNIFDLLSPERIIDVLKYFTFVRSVEDNCGEGYRIVARWNQYWAAKKAFQRIENYVTGKSEANTGLIWHWQGSGKTYLMYFIANWYAENQERLGVSHATTFIIVDRRDLQEQHSSRIESLRGGAVKPEVIETSSKLKRVLDKLARGEISGSHIYIVIIQKFSRGERFPVVPEHVARYTLILRDEAHRTEHGSLMAALEKSLPGSMKFAFTGTPLATELTKNELRDTFAKYSRFDGGKFLHSYFIDDAVRDGVVVPILYRPIKESYFSIDKKSLEEEFGKKEVDIDKLSKEINKKLLGSDKFLRKLAKYVVEHLPDDTDDLNTKAMVVVADRGACVRFKEYFDDELRKVAGRGKYVRISPDKVDTFSAVVMTYGKKPNDYGDFLEKQKEIFGCNKCDEDRLNEVIVEKFNREEYPKVLIVTDKLLTGFDSPVLKTMYVAKAMNGPRLLQAISRVNRPYKNYTGLIVDAAGILKRILDLYNFYTMKLERPTSVVFADEEEFMKRIRKITNVVKNLLDVEGVSLKVVVTSEGYEELKDFKKLMYREHVLSYMWELVKLVDVAKFVFEKLARGDEKEFVKSVRKALIVFRNQYCRRYPEHCQKPDIDFSKFVDFGNLVDVSGNIKLFVRDFEESIDDVKLSRTVVESTLKRLKADKRLKPFTSVQEKIKAIEKLLKKIEDFEHRHDILQMLNEIAEFYGTLDSPDAYLDALEREYGISFKETRKLLKSGFPPGESIERAMTLAVMRDVTGKKKVNIKEIVEGLASYFRE